MPGIGDRLEGIHAVTAALRAGRVVSMTVERGPAKSGEMRQLIALAEEVGAAVKLVADVSPLAATSAPQGVVATARPLPTVSLVDLVERAARPALIVLDHAEDPRNVGAIARSARAAGFDGMVVAERRAAPLGATAFKAAVGAFESLPVAVVNSIADTVARLQERSVWTVALDAAGADSLYDLRILDEAVAIIIGAEGRGVAPLVAKRCDVVARLPMALGVESLNASVAAALAMFAVARARGSLA